MCYGLTLQNVPGGWLSTFEDIIQIIITSSKIVYKVNFIQYIQHITNQLTNNKTKNTTWRLHQSCKPFFVEPIITSNHKYFIMIIIFNYLIFSK